MLYVTANRPVMNAKDIFKPKTKLLYMNLVKLSTCFNPYSIEVKYSLTVFGGRGVFFFTLSLF